MSFRIYMLRDLINPEKTFGNLGNCLLQHSPYFSSQYVSEVLCFTWLPFPIFEKIETTFNSLLSCTMVMLEMQLANQQLYDDKLSFQNSLMTCEVKNVCIIYKNFIEAQEYIKYIGKCNMQHRMYFVHCIVGIYTQHTIYFILCI